MRRRTCGWEWLYVGLALLGYLTGWLPARTEGANCCTASVRIALDDRSSLADARSVGLPRRKGKMVADTVQLGLGVRPFQAASGEIVYIQPEGSSAALYTLRFDELRPDIAEIEMGEPIRRAAVSARSRDVGLPWRNSPYFDELLRWVVWRDGRSIKALSSVMQGPLVADLAAEPAALVQPPLKTKDGPVEVLAITADRAHVTLVSFSSGPFGDNPNSTVDWTVPLPTTAVGFSAALAAAGQGDARHVAFTARRQSGFDIYHSRYTRRGGLEPFQSTHVDTGIPLEAAPVAAFVDSAGVARVAVLAVGAEHEHPCILAEAAFDATGKPLDAAVSKFSNLKGAPNSGAALYSQNDGGPLRLDAVVAVTGQELLHLDSARHLVPVAVQGQTTSPIMLAPGQNATFVLYQDPTRGLYFEAL